MVVALYILVFPFVIIYSKSKFNRYINIVSVFTALWFVFGAISSLGLLGLRRPNNSVYIYGLLFVLVFDIVFLLFYRRGQFDDLNNNINSNFKRALVFQFFALALIIPLLVKTINLYLSLGDMSSVRNHYFSGGLFNSEYLDFIFKNIPIAILESLILFYVYYFFKTGKINSLILALTNSVFISYINGGRYSLLLFLYSIVIMIISGYSLDYRGYYHRYKKQLFILIALAVALLIATSIHRGQQIINSFILYFSGSFSFLDYIICYPDYFGLRQHTFGYLTFGALLEPIVLLLKATGLVSIKVPSYLFNVVCQNYYDIGVTGSRVLYNANTTILYYFLRDFGLVGIIIGGVALATLLLFLLKKWENGSDYYGLLYIYVVNALFNSVMTYQLFGSKPLIIALVLFLIVQNKYRIVFHWH